MRRASWIAVNLIAKEDQIATVATRLWDLSDNLGSWDRVALCVADDFGYPSHYSQLRSVVICGDNRTRNVEFRENGISNHRHREFILLLFVHCEGRRVRSSKNPRYTRKYFRKVDWYEHSRCRWEFWEPKIPASLDIASKILAKLLGGL